jgi:hypothetical protein
MHALVDSAFCGFFGRRYQRAVKRPQHASMSGLINGGRILGCSMGLTFRTISDQKGVRLDTYRMRSGIRRLLWKHHFGMDGECRRKPALAGEISPAMGSLGFHSDCVQ